VTRGRTGAVLPAHLVNGLTRRLILLAALESIE